MIVKVILLIYLFYKLIFSKCTGDLICGTKNCERDTGTYTRKQNCCMNDTTICDGGPGTKHCCKPDRPCKLREGDCHEDDTLCEDGLMCTKKCKEMDRNNFNKKAKKYTWCCWENVTTWD